MSFFSWLRNRVALQSHRPRAQHRTATGSFRPRLEALEDRTVPSTLRVTSTLDSGKGSLRDAVAHASNNGRDSIVFDHSVYGRTINLYQQLTITTGLTIQGPGAGLVTLSTNYNFGDPWGQSTRVFEVNSARPVFLSGLTISDNGGSSQGGAILNHSTLTVSNCDLSDNAASYGGGIYNAGTMTLSNCTLARDTASHGGGIYNAGTMTVSGCTLSFDYDDFRHGIYNVGTLSVGTSTLVWNDILGPYADGGGNTFITGRPYIGTFTASSGSVTAGNSLTLTAGNIADANPGATITQVLFYVNGYGGTPFGVATQTSPGVWTFTFTVGAWAPGNYTFFAQVVDSYGTFNSAAGPTVQVT
jgi:hypothetical protein